MLTMELQVLLLVNRWFTWWVLAGQRGIVRLVLVGRNCRIGRPSSRERRRRPELSGTGRKFPLQNGRRLGLRGQRWLDGDDPMRG